MIVALLLAVLWKVIKPFHATGLFLYLLKTENLWFSDVFRGYRKRSVTWNGLKESGLVTINVTCSVVVIAVYEKKLFPEV